MTEFNAVQYRVVAVLWIYAADRTPVLRTALVLRYGFSLDAWTEPGESLLKSRFYYHNTGPLYTISYCECSRDRCPPRPNGAILFKWTASASTGGRPHSLPTAHTPPARCSSTYSAYSQTLLYAHLLHLLNSRSASTKLAHPRSQKKTTRR